MVVGGAEAGALAGCTTTRGGCWHPASIRPIAIAARIEPYLKMSGFVVIIRDSFVLRSSEFCSAQARFRPNHFGPCRTAQLRLAICGELASTSAMLTNAPYSQSLATPPSHV